MHPFPYKLGLRRSEVDHRDLKMCVPPNVVLPVKAEVPLRAIYNQQDINACSANVIANQILSLEGYKDYVMPSRLFQYYNSRLIDGTTTEDEGTTYRTAYKGLAKFGFCDENIWEYTKDNVFKQPAEEGYDKANKTLVQKYKSLVPSLYAIKYAIAQGYPVAIGVMLHENFNNLDSNFVIPPPQSCAVGGHALLAISYNDTTRLFKVVNSWGVEWGDKGCCYMRYEDMVNPNYVFEHWCIAKE